MTARARRRSSRCSPTPRPMMARRSSASTPMRPRCFSPAPAPLRSSARCAFPFSTIRLSPSARAPARRSFGSICRSRPRSTAAWWRSRARRTAPKLDGAGTAVEWAVEMQRFDENATLDRLAPTGKIDAALSDALGRAVAALHARAGAVEAEPWIAALADYIEQNDAAFRALPDLFPPAGVELLTTKSRAAHARIRPLLLERGHRGLIRRLHGDLHLGNIVLLDGRPVAFDAIEFSALIASGDVLYDLAFLLMDLVERGLASSANVVFNRYLADTKRTEDLDALAGLPLFLSMRAAIRAKVTAARIEHAAPDQTAAIARSARAYFDFARRFIEPSAPRLVAVGGLSGTGKSALAYALAPQLAPAPGAVVLRSDVERKMLFGKDEHDKLPEDAYSPAVTARVYASIADKARRALAAGHSAVIDAVFARPQE